MPCSHQAGPRQDGGAVYDVSGSGRHRTAAGIPYVERDKVRQSGCLKTTVHDKAEHTHTLTVAVAWFLRGSCPCRHPKKVSHRVYKIRAHEVRDLLKSTLLASGCKQYAADHVLGHAPRDSYEKQATLYPEELRAEYAKASSRINIFLKVEHNLNSPEDPESQNTRIRELEAEVRTLKESKTVDAVTEGAYKDAISEMNEKIKHLMYLFDSLPDSVKEAMATKTKGPDSLT